MDTWQLQDCFLIDDMERLDHGQYFQSDFQCPELDVFFVPITSTKLIFVHRQNINEFFDRLLARKSPDKSVYIRLKWLVYLHSLISSFGDNNPMMYSYTIKALHLYSDFIPIIAKNLGPYQQHLIASLFKPYLQYLIKFCMFFTLEDHDKQNIQNANQSDDRVNWYRLYNFVHWARQTFNQPLSEVKVFFNKKFPYLNHIGARIYSDLKKCIQKLKGEYKRVDGINITLIEIQKLEEKIINFYQEHLFFTTNDYQIVGSEIKDYSKAEVTDFLMTPNKKNNANKLSFLETTPCQLTIS